MAGEMVVTMVGSITEPVLRFTPQGKPWVSFNLAHNNRVKVGDEWQDGEPTWVNVKAWDGMAENIAESLEKGSRVIVQGRLSTRKWTTESNEERTGLQLEADEVGPALRWATAKPVKVGQGGQARPAQQDAGMQRSRTAQPQGDPWAAPAASNDPPF